MRSLTQLADFRQPLLAAQDAGHRLMLVLAMEEEKGMGLAQQLSHLSRSCLWVDVLKQHQTLVIDHQYISATQASQHLGTSHQSLVYNAHRGFNASSLCAVSGTLRGGGVLILLTPPKSQWHANFDTQLKAYGQSANHAHSYFIQWWQQQWQHHAAVYVLDELLHEAQSQAESQAQSQVNHPNWTPVPQLPNLSQLLQATEAQQHIVNQLVTAYHQQSNVVFTLDAPRGRGKSACLGWLIKAIAENAQHGPVVVTAPSKKALGTMLHTATASSINFYALDALLNSTPQAGMLIVDEAASIPLSQLIKLINHYPLVVLSSTQDGYEGSGQGYRLKLPQMINTLGKNSKAMTLNEPMRWQANDPLEEFIRSSFLCDVHIPEPALERMPDAQEPLTYSLLTGASLAKNHDLLRQVYPLLRLAHYQTTPQDLRLLLDHPQHKIHLCFRDDVLVGIAWVAQEGGLKPCLAQQIGLGERRIQGHLLAQILAQQAGFPIACELISWRVQRLVVSPLLQGQGIGSSLVQHVYGLAKATQVDFVGASFSASTDSLRFWQRNHFQPAWLGLRADTATGLNSVQVMQAISLEAKQLAQRLSCHLRDYLAFGQHLWFAAVDAQTWQHLAAAAPSATATMLDFQQQQRLLSLLAKGHAGFSGPLYLLYQQLHDQKHQQMVIYAAQHNTHRGLQRGVRQLALSLITSTDEQ